MKQEQAIHIKLEYEEALQSKKDILISEMSLLKIVKNIKKYRSLRIKELELKLNLHEKMKEILKNIRKLKIVLPKVKLPELLQKETDNETKSPGKTIQEKRLENDLEMQLLEIQDKLKSL